jgi:hypothetical protein
MAGHAGIVNGVGAALEGLVDGTGVVGAAIVVLEAAGCGAQTVCAGVLITVADSKEETAGDAPSPGTTTRTPGIVLKAAIASSRAEGLSAHTVASRPAKRTVAVSRHPSSVPCAWSARPDSIA